MSNSIDFNPSWTSAPGETIVDLLDEKGLSLDEFSSIIGKSTNSVQKLIDGHGEIDISIAKKLATYLGASVDFWLNRETQYRCDLERLEESTFEINERSWLLDISASDLIKFGWIKADRTVASRVKACLEFFNVSTIQDWYRKYDNDLKAVAFRTSDTYEHKNGAVTAWLRYGAIKAEELDCQLWNPELLKSKLSDLRTITREKDPAVIIQKIQSICNLCGVAVVVARAPSGCRASGATTFLHDGRAMVLLSLRFRADDHFWFTFFHEIGHLLMHDPKTLFLEDGSKVTAVEEEEANVFSESVMIPKDVKHELCDLIIPAKEIVNARRVMRFAKRIGISAGIVVGQLQHKDIIAHNRLNKIKTRYSWKDIEC